MCYNILKMFGAESKYFIQVMGNYDIVPIFGSKFPNVFPIALVLLVALNLCSVYQWIKKKVFEKEKIAFKSEQNNSIFSQSESDVFKNP